MNIRARSFLASLASLTLASTGVAGFASAETVSGRAPEPLRQTFRFVWTRGAGAASCADGRALARAVTTRLGRDPFSDASDQSIEGVVAREGDRWVARLYRRSRGASASSDETARVLSSTSASCDSVDDATTLAIAIAIDPAHALDPPKPAPPAPEPTPLPNVRMDNGQMDQAPILARAEVHAQGILAFGLLPGVAPGAEIAASWGVGRSVRVELGAMALPESRTSGAAAADEAFAFGLFAGRARACLEPFPAASTTHVALDFCGGGALGALHAVVYSPIPTEPGERIWGAATAGARLRVAPFTSPGSLLFGLEAEAVLPFVRDKFAVEAQPGTVFQQSVVGMMLSATVGWAIR